LSSRAATFDCRSSRNCEGFTALRLGSVVLAEHLTRAMHRVMLVEHGQKPAPVRRKLRVDLPRRSRCGADPSSARCGRRTRAEQAAAVGRDHVLASYVDLRRSRVAATFGALVSPPHPLASNCRQEIQQAALSPERAIAGGDERR
jgi:hypothetical protein